MKGYNIRVNSDTPELRVFILVAQQLSNKHLKEMGYATPALNTVRFELGPRYIRIYKEETGARRSVYCFIDRTNGDILKGSWKAPVKNGVRGNIFASDWKDKIDWHGPKYLR